MKNKTTIVGTVQKRSKKHRKTKMDIRKTTIHEL
jgi:hypothetical protein